MLISYNNKIIVLNFNYIFVFLNIYLFILFIMPIMNTQKSKT